MVMSNAASSSCNRTGVPIKRPRRIHELKFVSWNIHDIRTSNEGLKSSMDDFTELLNKNDVFCLQETKEPVKIAGFRCFNSNRKSSKSGGVCIGVRNDISKGVISVNTGCCDDIVAVKFKKGFFATSADYVLMNVYDSPINSSFKQNNPEDLSTLDKASEILNRLPSDTEVILMGDFNARTGVEPDYNDPHFDPLSTYQNDLENVMQHVPIRSNKDPKLNSNGKPFLEFIKGHGLIILNGRTLGDVYGDITCLKYNGCSVVDYICTSANINSNVMSMRVGEFSHLSDHYPLLMSLKLGKLSIQSSSLPSFDDAPAAWKWKKDAANLNMNSSSAYSDAQCEPQFVESVRNLLEANISGEDDVFDLNDKVMKLFDNLASSSLSRKGGHRKNSNRKKWFDWSCRSAKRELNKAASLSGRNPTNDELRHKYHQQKKDYKNLIKSKRSEFLFGLNTNIENGKNIDWKSFKQLQEYHKEDDSFDTYDLYNFYVFFQDLYKNRCTKFSHSEGTTTDANIPAESELENLNSPFSIDEIDAAIKRLKPNKGVSLDCISNEMIKHTNAEVRSVVQLLFNNCLEYGIYPWSASLTTPLHKKGDKENPDNYRAITLGSCLGKLFSSLILGRLVNFRKNECPDVPNQLGFCPGSQTSDHILTLKTLVEKYVGKKKKRLYTCFVDYRKAFDRVCRDALLFKLAHMGISGNLFKCIQHMYRRSTTRIKLIKKISEAIDIRVGTEQGHPLSPELFKIFIHDLSAELNTVSNDSCPYLMDTMINHLLWADDLVLMALNKENLQDLLDILGRYVDTWELEINISKTNVMVFNASSKILKESHGFLLRNIKVEPVKNYTYLGITFSLNGSFKVAISQLTSKARRAFFQIQRTVVTEALSIKSLLILFDSLIKPIITYACQVWLPNTNTGKSWLNFHQSDERTTLIQSSAIDCFERLHLKFLKWCLGVHSKASNLGCYGDTGRMPLGISVIRTSLNYFRRVAVISANQPDSLVGKAFLEQQHLNLDWFKTWDSIDGQLDNNSHTKGQLFFEEMFRIEWNNKRRTQSKLSFYNEIKPLFGYEPYLDIRNSSKRKNLARFRISAHDLNIEQGRYSTKESVPTIMDKICRFCCCEEDKTYIALFQAILPDFNPIIESEQHVLTECPGYHHLRINLSDDLKCQLMQCNYMEMFYNPIMAKELGSYLAKCFLHRNPKGKMVKKKKKKIRSARKKK
jgi:exonuclease III